MKYVCEVCNKQFGTPEAAKVCELAHEKEKAHVTAKAATEEKISGIVNAFIERYGVMPSIELTEANQKIIAQAIADEIEGAVERMFKLLDADE